MLYDDIVREVILVEGGFVNDPDDRGGATRYGITESLARRNGYDGDMDALPLDKAKEIYQRVFWIPMRGEDVLAISALMAFEVFEFSVHAGTFAAVQTLQSCLNLLNMQERLYDDIEEDGILGTKSLHALERYMAQRDEKVLARFYNARQAEQYAQLAIRRQVNERFLYGWLVKRTMLSFVV